MQSLDCADTEEIQPEAEWGTLPTGETTSLQTVCMLESQTGVSLESDEEETILIDYMQVAARESQESQSASVGGVMGMLADENARALVYDDDEPEESQATIRNEEAPVSDIFVIESITPRSKGMRKGIAEIHNDRRKTVGVTNGKALQFNIAISNKANLFEGHTFVKMGFVGLNRYQERVRFVLHFANIQMDSGEFGNRKEDEYHSLMVQSNSWYASETTVQGRQVPIHSTFVASAARLFCNRLPTGKDQEFWISNDSTLPIHGGSYAFAIQAMLDGLPDSYIYNGHADPAYCNLPLFQASGIGIKALAGDDVIIKTLNAKAEAKKYKDSGVRHWIGGQKPVGPCLIDSDYPLMLMMLSDKPEVAAADIDATVKASVVSL